MEILISTLSALATPTNFFYMFVGIALSSTLVALPGFNTKMAMTICMPFLFYMDSVSGLCLLISILAVSNTANSVPSILFAIPGASSSQAVIIDGYQMSRKGQGGRALIASFVASAAGGILGSAVLFSFIPFAHNMILWFGPVELLCLTVAGILMIGVLSGSTPLDGIIVGLLGIMASFIGMDMITAEPRYVFDTPELMDGLGIVAVVVGLYALPELSTLYISNTSINKLSNIESIKQMSKGFFDVCKNKILLLYNSLLGTICGFIPGIGGGIIDWVSLALTKQFVRDSALIGKGDVRSVIAIDSATNAKEGGALIPTLLFGIPGTSTLALLLASFDIIQVPTGIDLLTHKDHLIYLIFWILTISTLATSIICILATPLLIRITAIKTGMLLPHLIVLLCVGVFLVSNNFFNLWIMLGLSILGYWLKQHNWPRAPFLIGFVLGPACEQYFGTAYQIHGWSLATHPSVVLCFSALLLIFFIGYGFKKHAKSL